MTYFVHDIDAIVVTHTLRVSAALNLKLLPCRGHPLVKEKPKS
jgi:hypothetical protein